MTNAIIVMLGLDVALLAHGLRFDEPQSPPNKPMIWIHLPKAGGSMMCATATRNGENVVQPSNNCNWDAKDSSHFMGGFDHPPQVTCEMRAAYFRAHNYTWGQIEREINDEDLCFHDFDYGVLLRHPADYMHSLLNCFHKRGVNSKSIDNNIQCVIDRGSGPSCTGLKQFDPRRKPHMFFDNYMTRALGGRDVWDLPVGEVGSHHVDRILERFDKFTTIMVWSDIPSSTFFHDAFGWKQPPRKVHDSKYALENFTEWQASVFETLNPHDFRIWNHFKDVAPEQRVKARRF